mgnify:CR=1 FL=1
MMMMPSIFGGNLFNDDWMDFSFPDIDKELYGKHAKNLMKTDVKEKDGNYEVAIDLPGFKKDEITALVSHSMTYLTYSVEQYTVPEEGQWYYMNDTPVGSVIAFSDLETQRKLFAEFIYEELITGNTTSTSSN